MTTYIIQRILHMILVLFIITVIVFLVIRLLPGDPILLYLTSQSVEDISQERIDKLRHDLGLDRSMFVQYFDWLFQVVRGDLGNSIIYVAYKSRHTSDVPTNYLVSNLSHTLSRPHFGKCANGDEISS